MLQALKLDPASRPAAAREREAGPDLQDPTFAGFMVSAASFAQLPGPTPATAPVPRREIPQRPAETRRAASRAESEPQRQVSQKTEARAERAKPEDRVEDARPQAQDAETTPGDPAASRAAANPDKPQASQAEPAKAEAASPLAATATAAAATAPSEGILSKIPAAHNPASPAEAGSAKVASPAPAGTMAAMPAAASKAQAALEKAAPGVQLRFQFSEGAPADTPSKPALTELLSIPKPEMEIPKPVLNAGRSEAPAAKEAPATPLQASPVAADTAPLPLPSTITLTPGHEAILAFSAKAESLPGKASTSSGVPIAAAAGPAADVRGATPIPALESAQGARANATFAQLDGSIRWLIKHQEKGAEIQLNPESLGRVVIKLRVEGGEVHARVWASEASTVPLLQDQKAALEASLHQQGLNLGSFDLQQGRRGDDTPSAPERAALAPSGPRIADSMERKHDLPSVSPAALGGAHLIEILA